MATKNLKIDLLDTDVIIEVEIEETMSFGNVITKLKSAEHLHSDRIYFIKSPAGTPIKESDNINQYKQNSLVVTENPEWKSSETVSSSLTEVPEISSVMMLYDNKYWILPVIPGISWDNDNLQSQLFTLKDIETINGRKLTLNLIIQYSVIDSTLSGKYGQERALKMKQILMDALNVEVMVNDISENNLYENFIKLSGKLHYYLTSHMELKWGTKIDSVSIMSFREYGNT